MPLLGARAPPPPPKRLNVAPGSSSSVEVYGCRTEYPQGGVYEMSMIEVQMHQIIII